MGVAYLMSTIHNSAPLERRYARIPSLYLLSGIGRAARNMYVGRSASKRVAVPAAGRQGQVKCSCAGEICLDVIVHCTLQSFIQVNLRIFYNGHCRSGLMSAHGILASCSPFVSHGLDRPVTPLTRSLAICWHRMLVTVCKFGKCMSCPVACG